MVRDIHIHPDGSAADCDLYRSTNDEAKWINEGNVNRVVTFNNGSPFGQSEYPVPAGGSTQSGPVTADVPARYPYEIRAGIAANEPAADPIIIVH
jgi:hypothetical protein